MVKSVPNDQKSDLWPLANRKQEFLKVWHLAQFEVLNWF